MPPPPKWCGTAQYFGQRRSRQTRIPKEKITLSQQIALNTPGCLSKPWAHYNTTLEAPISVNNVQSEFNTFQTIPDRTPMRLELCHSCARQRHLDTMHNMRTLQAQAKVTIHFQGLSCVILHCRHLCCLRNLRFQRAEKKRCRSPPVIDSSGLEVK